MSGVFRANRTTTKSSFTSTFRWMYWREYTASEPAFRIHAEGGDIDRLKLHLTYKKKQEKGLWWWANSSLSVSPRSTIRHYYTRLLRRSFENALKERGYSKDGSRIKRDSEEGGEGLTGTLQILANAKVADKKWDNVQEDCRNTLDLVIKLQHNTASGRGLIWPHTRRGQPRPQTKKGQDTSGHTIDLGR
jgi:hypothetical protein